MEEALPNVKIQPLDALLLDEPLTIAAANGTDVPFDGWAEVELQVCSKNYGNVTIQVPMLISQNHLSAPLLGSNVIVEIVKEQKEGADISALLKEALSISDSTVEALVSALQLMAPDLTTPECSVRTGKRGATIPAGQVCEVRCRIRQWREGGAMLFQPNVVSNCPEGLELFPALVDVPRGPQRLSKSLSKTPLSMTCIFQTEQFWERWKKSLKLNQSTAFQVAQSQCLSQLPIHPLFRPAQINKKT